LLSTGSSKGYTVSYDLGRRFHLVGLQEIVVMIHNGEYGRAISSLEHDVKDETLSPQQRIECCGWLAECNLRLEEHGEAGNSYVEAVRIVLSQKIDNRSKAKQGLPFCMKALEAYERGGDPADVLVASRLKQYLIGLSK
jgi:hypothetical protein